MTEKIAILSGKGGVGKTFTSLNLASALTCLGKDVILVDGNLSNPNIGIFLGAPSVQVSLHDVLKGKKHITEAIYSHNSGIKVIPGSISVSTSKGINLDNLRKSLYSLEGLADFVIVDGAPGMPSENLTLIGSVNNIIVVTNPELPALTDALKTIKVAESYHKKVLGIVLTKTGNQSDITLENVESLLGCRVLAEIPDDKKARESLVKKDILVNLFPRNKVAISYKKLASYLLNETYQANKGIIPKILDGFRKKQ